MSAVVISTRLPQEDADRLKVLARERRMSVCDLVRYFLLMELHR